MRFLLDANICIYIIKRKPQEVFDRFQNLSLSDIGISSITLAELDYGSKRIFGLSAHACLLTYLRGKWV